MFNWPAVHAEGGTRAPACAVGAGDAHPAAGSALGGPRFLSHASH